MRRNRSKIDIIKLEESDLGYMTQYHNLLMKELEESRRVDNGRVSVMK